MAGPADEIIVRLTADASQLESGLSGATSSVQAAQEAMASSGESAADAMAVASQTAAEATVKSLERIRLATSAQIMQWRAAASEITATSQAQAEAVAASQQEIEASVVETVAPIDAATEEIAAAPLTVAEAYQEMLASVQASLGEYASNFDVLYAMQAELDAAMTAGTLSADAYAESLDMLDAQTEALNASVQQDIAWINSQAAAMQEAAVAATEDGAALDADTGATEANIAAKGHYIGIFGLLGRAMGFLMTPLGAVTAGIAALGFDAAQQSGRVSGLHDALLVTGNAAGVTTGQLDEWASSVGNTIGTVGDAQTAYQALAQSGQFVGSSLKQAGDAAEIFSELTDISSTQAGTAVERMATDPLSAMKYLTDAQQEEVRSLMDVGDKAEAGRVAVADFAQAMQKAAEEAKGDIGIFTRLGDAIANAWDNTGRSIDVALGGGTIEERLAILRREREQPQSVNPAINAEMNAALDAQIAKLEALKKAQEETAKENALSHDWVHTASGFGKAGLAADEETVKRTEAVQNMGYAQRVAYEKAYWEHILTIATKGSAEYIAAYEKLEGNLGGHHPKAPYIAAGDSGWNVGALSPDDRAMMAVEERQIAARQKAQQIADEVQKTQIGSQASHSTALLDMQRSHVQALAGMGSISASSEIAQEQSLADQIYAIKLNEYQRELALAKDKPTQQASINAEIIRAQDTLAQTTQTLADKSAADQIKTAESVVAPITQAFGGIVTGYIQGTLTMQQAEQRMGSAILAEAVNRGVQMITHHIAVEEAKTLATAAGTAQRLALNVVAEGEALAVHAAAAIKWILTEAAKAAAGAFSAMAGIPYVGPILAVAAGAAMLAEVGGLVGHVASAEGGWERVPFDGAPAVLHKDEMVLPAELADGVRNMSGSGGQTQIHIHTFDPVSFEQYLKRNPKALLNALGHAGRTGHAFA